MVTKKKPRPKTMKFSTLQRLSFCNSKRLPRAVNMGGLRHEWVGIGWIEVGELKGDETKIVEDEQA